MKEGLWWRKQLAGPSWWPERQVQLMTAQPVPVSGAWGRASGQAPTGNWAVHVMQVDLRESAAATASLSQAHMRFVSTERASTHAPVLRKQLDELPETGAAAQPTS